MNVEEMPVSTELDEEVIPTSDSVHSDNELDDVIPCEPIEFGEQDMGNVPVYSGDDNLYNDSYSTPSVPVSEMVDIAPHTISTGNELEEEFIPEAHNTLDDDELDDVTMMPETI